MKNDNTYRKTEIWYYMMITLLWIILMLLTPACNSSSSLKEAVPADEIREGISLKEAQELVSFPICIPSYVPSGIKKKPEIIYHANFGDPQESDIRLQFHSLDSSKIAVEIYQFYDPEASIPTELADQVRDFYVRRLLAWIVGWPKTDEVWKQGQIVSNTTKLHNNNVEGWLFEIMEPISLQANMIEWRDAPVTYQVFTYLSVEDAKSIIESIPKITDCG